MKVSYIINYCQMKVSYAKTVYGQKEIDAVVKCLNEGTQMGKNSREFEKQIAKLFDKKYGLYVNSGSSALYVGVEAMKKVFKWKDGDEVITPALTFSTTVGSIVKAGLKPIFVDVKRLTYCIDVEQIEAVITDKTVAISAPNLLGNVCEWEKIASIAQKHGLKIIEDSADTLGATLNGKSSGHWSDMSITSFYGSHIINCAGNGGMLTLNDDEFLKEAKLLRSWGRSSSIFDEASEAIENRFNVDVDGIEYDAKFIFERIGYNVEGNELGAAFGLQQLTDLQQNIETRTNNFNTQTAFFKRYEEFFETPVQTENSRTGWLAYPIMIKKSAPFKRRDFQIFLEKEGIQTRTVFTGNVTRQPGYKNLDYRIHPNGLKIADEVMQYGCLLACHHGLTKEMVDYMHEKVEGFVSKFM